MPDTFYTPTHLLQSRIHVLLIGTGGTGCEAADALVRVHLALIQLGHPGGICVTALDGDRVSTANIGRQRFGPSDVGHPKSHVLIHRYNLFYGLDWSAYAENWTPELGFSTQDNRLPHVVVSCADRARVRLDIAQAGRDLPAGTLWLDFGNGARVAQCVLGHLGRQQKDDAAQRLPNVVDLFGGQLAKIDDRQAPSCSLAEALRAQDLFVNRSITDAGMNILWQLLRHGCIQYHGAFVDLQEGSQRPLRIDPLEWAFYQGQTRAA